MLIQYYLFHSVKKVLESNFHEIEGMIKDYENSRDISGLVTTSFFVNK